MKKNCFVIKNPPGGHFEEVRFICRKKTQGTADATELPDALREEAERIIAEYGLPVRKKNAARKESSSPLSALRYYFWGMGSCGVLFMLAALALKWLR